MLTNAEFSKTSDFQETRQMDSNQEVEKKKVRRISENLTKITESMAEK